MQDHSVHNIHFKGVRLNVADVARSERYYSSVFGMKRVEVPGSSEVILKSPDRATILGLFTERTLLPARSAFGRLAMFTSRAQMAPQAVLNVSHHGTVQVIDVNGSLLAFAHDPDNYLIELYAP